MVIKKNRGRIKNKPIEVVKQFSASNKLVTTVVNKIYHKIKKNKKKKIKINSI